MHRKLMVDIKRSRGALSKCKTKAQLDQESSKISALTGAHSNFISAIKELKHDDLFEDLSSDVTEFLKNALTCILNVACVFAINQMIKLAKFLTLARRRLILNRAKASRKSIVAKLLLPANLQS